jgi:hypothetical protein
MLFSTMREMIFHDMYDEDNGSLNCIIKLDDHGNIVIDWGNIQVSDDQFINYVKRNVWESLYSQINDIVDELVDAVDNKLAEL